MTAFRSQKLIREIVPLLPAAAYLMVFLVLILTYLIQLSFSAAGGAHFPTLTTFQLVVSGEPFKTAFVNTLLFVMVGTPLELCTGIMLVLILYRSFRFRNFVRSLFLIPLAIPALVTAIVLLILFDYPGGHINDLLTGKYGYFPALLHSPIDWRGSRFGALGISLIGKVWRDMPISMLILLSGINAIDPELFDAAKTMGAGYMQRLRYVILPLLLPACTTVVLLRSIEMWKEFIFPFVLAGRYSLLGTLIESLYNYWGQSQEAAVVALILVVCIIITALIFLTSMNYLRHRIAQGGWHGQAI
jgi:ABC-type sugar transport system permease subunit